jgi:2-succinyl-5-enolpyruvyl-6-hydroxy-3-cyclohexene-1-carboxylate synthase
MQLFENNPTHTQFCNRGTSGIDGSTSTAVGASVASKTPTLLISGDLSFLYDSNGLWNTHFRNDFKIVVINNGGGGIFRILPGTQSDATFATFFETQHALTAKQLAKMYGFRYQKVRSNWGLKRALSSFFKPSSQPKLLEIFTPAEKNAELLKNYFKFLAG